MESYGQLDPVDGVQLGGVEDLEGSEEAVDLDEETGAKGREESVAEGLIQGDHDLGELEPDPRHVRDT